jgi:hypothetical protein
MKQLTLITALLFLGLSAYSQKVKMSEDAKSRYMTKDEQGATAENNDSFEIYQILEAIYADKDGAFQIRLIEPTKELGTRTAEYQFPEFKKLQSMTFSERGEVELLNYLSENGWTVVSVVTDGIKEQYSKKFYIKKAMSR